jgi:hypothetical protein
MRNLICVWWYRPIIPALERLMKKDLKFEVSLGYIVGPCLKTPKWGGGGRWPK